MQGKMDPIYIIYVCTELVFISGFTTAPKEPVKAKRLMRPGEDQPMGFYFEKEEAFELIREHSNDLYENYFTYAFVEEVTPGLGCLSSETRWVFKMNREIGQYEELEIPEFLTDTNRLVLE